MSKNKPPANLDALIEVPFWLEDVALVRLINEANQKLRYLLADRTCLMSEKDKWFRAWLEETRKRDGRLLRSRELDVLRRDAILATEQREPRARRGIRLR